MASPEKFSRFCGSGKEPSHFKEAIEKVRFMGLAKRVLLVPPERLPTMIEIAGNDPLLKEQVIRDFGSMEGQRRRIEGALRG